MTSLTRGLSVLNSLRKNEIEVPQGARNENKGPARSAEALLHPERSFSAAREAAPSCRGLPRRLPAVLAALLRNLFHLPQVVQVVSGEHAHHVGDGFPASLLVHTVVFPEVFRD